MTKVLERPTTELRSQTEVLPRPIEAESRIPEPVTPRRLMNGFWWMLAIAVVGLVGALLIVEAVSDEPVAAPSIQYETLREPYELPQTPVFWTTDYPVVRDPYEFTIRPVATAHLGLPEWTDLMPVTPSTQYLIVRDPYELPQQPAATTAYPIVRDPYELPGQQVVAPRYPIVRDP